MSKASSASAPHPRRWPGQGGTVRLLRVGTAVLAVAALVGASRAVIPPPGAAPASPAAALPGATRSGPATGAAAGPDAAARTVDLAIGHGATASSAAAGDPAANAVDGSASTLWCASGPSGELVVDLGRSDTLDGVGVTLGSDAAASRVTLDLSTAAGAWQPVASSRDLTVAGGTPSYLALASGQRARYARLRVTTSDGTRACVGELRLYGHDPATDTVMLGADLSFTPLETAAGTRFSDAGRASDPVQILKSHGANYVRMRLWVDPAPGYNDLATDLALARRVADAGMQIYLDLHYSDTWADPQHQTIPAAWRGQDLAALSATVRRYTHDVIAAFAGQGTPVSMVSIGNEIGNGMLWPIGRVDAAAGTGWDSLAALLRAGVAGARSANPAGHALRIMVHDNEGANLADSTRFFANLVSRGVLFDVIGLSYYPFFQGPVAAFRDTVDGLATRFGKDIVVAETSYPWTLTDGDATGNVVSRAGQATAGYPVSAGGQLSFVSDLLSILARVPGGHGAGLFYWEPDWVPGVGWQPGAGSQYDNLTLFDAQGRALPSVGLFEDPTEVCRRSAPHARPCVVAP